MLNVRVEIIGEDNYQVVLDQCTKIKFSLHDRTLLIEEGESTREYAAVVLVGFDDNCVTLEALQRPISGMGIAPKSFLIRVRYQA